MALLTRGPRPGLPRGARRPCRMQASTPGLPASTAEMVALASRSIQRALDQGHTRQKVELLLPAGQGAAGSARGFQAACELTQALFQDLTEEGPPLCKRLDCGDGDADEDGEPCAIFYPEARDFAAVVCPTAPRLDSLRGLVAQEERPLLLINPQWQAGQFLSDFGWGESATAARRFLASFHPSFVLREQRVGVPRRSPQEVSAKAMVGPGTVVRTLRAFPGPYEAYLMGADGGGRLLGSFPEAPSYGQLEGLVERSRARPAGG